MTENNATPSDVAIAGLLCVIGTLGTVLNGFGLIIVYNNAILNNAFGRLCFSHCIANFGVCAVFLLWVCPLTIVKDESVAASIFGKILGQINIFFWDVCVYSHLAISVNRFISITFPLQAVMLLTSQRAKIIVGIPWILGFCHIVPYFWCLLFPVWTESVLSDEECYISYHPSTWTWDFSPTECGILISTYFDMYTGFGVFTAMAILDLTTLYFLHKNHQLATDIVFDDRRNVEVVEIAKNRRKTEIRFFVQSCVQGAVFFYELTNFYILWRYNSNKYYVFFTTTFAWVLCHMLDGLVLTSFHVRGYQRQRRASMISSQRLFRSR